jgi:hypothetical protein
MKKKYLLFAGCLGILVLIATLFHSSFPLSNTSAQALNTPVETWKSGVTLEGDPGYANIEGRLLASSASFRSDRGVQDIYFAFPAAATARTVQLANFMIADRTGAYSGAATMTLEVLSFDGALQRTVSAQAVDLQTADLAQWAGLTISSNPDDLSIQPGEFLAVHFHLSDSPNGDLDVRPIFEIQVQ